MTGKHDSESTPTINLHQFCGTDGFSPRLARPFSRGEYTWATDGKIMVRVPRLPDVPESPDAPAVERVWPAEASGFVRVQPVDIPGPTRTRCDACEGRGTEHDCPDCMCECDECDGTGQIEEVGAVTFGDHHLNARYAKLMLTLPDLELAQSGEHLMRFRFEGGEGVLSLLRYGHRLPVVANLLPETVA